MKIIDRYVSSSLIVTSVLAVLVLTVVLVLANVFRQLVNRDAPLEVILTVVAFILPFSLTFTIPWGFLTSVLLVFGRMSAENELIALRSNGVSVPRVCASVFVLASLFVGLCLWINVEVAPRAQANMKDALYNIATSNPLTMFRSNKVIDEFPKHKIYVERNEGSKLFNLLVYEMNDDSLPVRVIAARDGWLETDGPHKRLLLHIYNGRFEQRDEQQPNDLSKIRQGITMQESTLPISLEELYEKNKKRHGVGTMTIAELEEHLKSEDPNRSQKDIESDKASAKTEINKRYSYALASLAFGLLGIPLAITAHRRETAIGFLFSLILGFVYFMFILVAEAQRSRPALHPELLVWFPNVLFMAIGGVLFYRLSRR